MKFDNDQTAIKIQMQKRILAVISAVLVALLFFTDFDTFLNSMTGLPRYVFVILFLSIFLLFYLYHLFLSSAFIYFSDEDNKIVLRFYQLNFFNSSKVSYEIPKNEFTGYKLELKLNKKKEMLILFRKYQGSIVRYPPVPISSLTKEERGKILKTLNQYAK
jgi:hypothetical protein